MSRTAVAVGRVESVGLSPSGVIAEMRLNSGTPIPSNVTASVKSVSAVGEQYIDLVPPSDPSSAKLHNGSRIDRQNTRIGQDVADLLKKSETLVNSLGDTRLRELLHETFIAANGSGPELARLIESARLLVDEANANYPQVSQLIDQAGPFLQAQIRAGADIKSLSDGLARFTSEVHQADPSFVRRWRPPRTRSTRPIPRFPASVLLSGVGGEHGQPGPGGRHLSQVDRTAAGGLAGAIRRDHHGGGRLSPGRGRQAGLQDRPRRPAAVLCRLRAPPLMRTPADETLRELPKDMYCKTAQNDPSDVRGARNYPCQEFPGKRAPTIQLCRDPKGYVPVGRNPGAVHRSPTTHR